MSLTAITFWILYVTGVLAAIFNPVVGMALYVLVYHLYPEGQWWGYPIRALGFGTSFTVAAATAIGLLIRRPSMEFGARQMQAPYVFALLLGLVAIGSLAWGMELSDRGQYQAVKYVKLMIAVFLLVRCVRKPLHYHFIIMAWLVGVLYLGYQAWGGSGHISGGRLAHGIGGPDFSDSSGLAVHLVASLPFMGAGFFMARSWWGRVFMLVTGALTVNTIIMTRTRNVVAGLAAMIVAGVLSLPRGYRLRGMVALVIGALLAAQLVDPGWWKRMHSVTQYEQDSSAMSRIAFWRAALNMANDNPLGVGLGNFRYYVGQYIPELRGKRSAHSTVATCLAELGWLGLMLLLAVLGCALWKVGQVRTAAREMPANIDLDFYRWTPRFHLGWHAMALRTALVGYLGGALFTTRLFAEDMWLLIGLAMCLHNVMLHARAEEELADGHRPGVRAEPGLPLPAEALGAPVQPAGRMNHVAPPN